MEFIVMIATLVGGYLFFTKTLLGQRLLQALNIIAKSDVDKMTTNRQKEEAALAKLTAALDEAKLKLNTLVGASNRENRKLAQLQAEKTALENDVKIAMDNKFTDDLVKSRVKKVVEKEAEIAAQQTAVDNLKSTMSLPEQAVQKAISDLEGTRALVNSDTYNALATEAIKSGNVVISQARDIQNGTTAIGNAHEAISLEHETEKAALELNYPSEDRQFEELKKQDQLNKKLAELEAKFKPQQ